MTRREYLDELLRLNDIVRQAKDNLVESMSHPSLKGYVRLNQEMYDLAQKRLELHIRKHRIVNKK